MGTIFQALNGVQAIDRLFQEGAASVGTEVAEFLQCLCSKRPCPTTLWRWRRRRHPRRRLRNDRASASPPCKAGRAPGRLLRAGSWPDRPRDESPRSLLKKHNAQLAKRGLVWRLSQQQRVKSRCVGSLNPRLPGARRSAAEAPPPPARVRRRGTTALRGDRSISTKNSTPKDLAERAQYDTRRLKP